MLQEIFGSNDSNKLENIELKDSESGDLLVMYEGEELLKLRMNEDNLLEAENGIIYMKN